MKKALKWTGIVLGLLIVGMVVYATFGLKQTLALDITGVDLNGIPDGTYTGSYESYRWTTTVDVTVKAHRITSIEPIVAQSGREDLIGALTAEIIDSQRTDADAVSGATASSNAFLKAVETALKGVGT